MALTRGLDLVPVGAEEALAQLRVPGAGGHRRAPLAPVVEPGQHIVIVKLRGDSLQLYYYYSLALLLRGDEVPRHAVGGVVVPQPRLRLAGPVTQAPQPAHSVPATSKYTCEGSVPGVITDWLARLALLQELQLVCP